MTSDRLYDLAASASKRAAEASAPTRTERRPFVHPGAPHPSEWVRRGDPTEDADTDARPKLHLVRPPATS